MAIPPVTSVGGLGAEFQIAPIESPLKAAPAKDGTGFGDLLTDQIGKLADLQRDGASQAQALATGQAEDVSEVVMAVERASLGLQLASQVRNKAVEAYQEIFRMQV